MTCTAQGCRNVQCYVCSKSCEYSHFDDASRGGKRGNCPLFDSVEQRHADEVKAAELKERERVAQENPNVDVEVFNFKFSDQVKSDEERRKGPNPPPVRAGMVVLPPPMPGVARGTFVPTKPSNSNPGQMLTKFTENPPGNWYHQAHVAQQFVPPPPVGVGGQWAQNFHVFPVQAQAQQIHAQPAQVQAQAQAQEQQAQARAQAQVQAQAQAQIRHAQLQAQAQAQAQARQAQVQAHLQARQAHLQAVRAAKQSQIQSQVNAEAQLAPFQQLFVAPPAPPAHHQASRARLPSVGPARPRPPSPPPAAWADLPGMHYGAGAPAPRMFAPAPAGQSVAGPAPGSGLLPALPVRAAHFSTRQASSVIDLTRDSSISPYQAVPQSRAA